MILILLWLLGLPLGLDRSSFCSCSASVTDNSGSVRAATHGPVNLIASTLTPTVALCCLRLFRNKPKSSWCRVVCDATTRKKRTKATCTSAYPRLEAQISQVGSVRWCLSGSETLIA
jgi:hypothetical protein